MLEEYALPLLLTQKLGEIRGKTRFQKLLYIVQKRSQERKLQLSVFSYEPYLYGPFSAELARTIDVLVSRDLLRRQFAKTDAGYTVSIFRLTPQGEKFLEEASVTKIIDKKVLSVLDEVAREEGDKPLVDLIATAKAL